MTRPGARLRDEEEGSILPLVAGYAALTLVVVLLVTAATSLYLERKRLFSLADGAALVGAESFDLAAVRPAGAAGGEEGPRLTTRGVQRDVTIYLAQAPTADLTALALESADTIDGLSATVTLSSSWSPPVVTLFIPDGIRLEVTATARSVIG